MADLPPDLILSSPQRNKLKIVENQESKRKELEKEQLKRLLYNTDNNKLKNLLKQSIDHVTINIKDVLDENDREKLPEMIFKVYKDRSLEVNFVDYINNKFKLNNKLRLAIYALVKCSDNSKLEIIDSIINLAYLDSKYSPDINFIKSRISSI